MQKFLLLFCNVVVYNTFDEHPFHIVWKGCLIFRCTFRDKEGKVKVMKTDKFLKTLLSSLMALSVISTSAAPVFAEDTVEDLDTVTAETTVAETGEEVAEETFDEEEILEEEEIIEEETTVAEASEFEETLDNVAVAVEAPEGAFPAGTKMAIENVEDEAILNAIQEKVGTEAKVIAAVDITFTYEGEAIQPEKAVQVTIANSDVEGKENLQVVHVDDKTEELTTEVVEHVVPEEAVDSVVFDADSFSVYAIVEPGTEQTDPETYSVKYEFYYLDKPYEFTNSDNETTYYQYVGEGETLYYPGTPECTEDLINPKFLGWFDESDNLVLDPNTDVENGIVITGVTANATVKLTAKYSATHYIIYHDKTNTNILATEAVDSDTNVSLKDGEEYRVVYTLDAEDSKDKAFIGWALEPNKRDEASVVDTVDIPNGTIELYPVIAPVFWYHFNKNDWVQNEDGEWVGSGAQYVAPRFVLQGESYAHRYGSDIPEITRPGYTFAGWYYDEELTQQLDTSVAPTADVKLYAKWDVKNTSYTVVYWKQKATDAVDTANEAKTYVYIGSDTSRVAPTNSKVSLTTADRNPSAHIGTSSDDPELAAGFGFNSVNSTTNEQVVKADGSTVLNVYFDRNVYTVTFRDSSSTNNWTASNGVYYPYRNYTTVRTVRCLYNSDITGIWTFNEGGVTYPRTFRNYPTGSWQPVKDNDSIDWQNDARITVLQVMPANNLRYINVATSNDTHTFHYYVEALPGASNTRTYNGVTYQPYTESSASINVDFNFIYPVDFWDLDGFNKVASVWNNGTAFTIQNRTEWGNHSGVYFYYSRVSKDLEFWDSIGDDSGRKDISSVSVKYQMPLTQYGDLVTVSDNRETVTINGVTRSHEGYRFKGLYSDPACTKEYVFDNETMPLNNVQVYVGWEKIRYRVWVQPNGGVLSPTESTWFNADYGELIQEYADIAETRNYIEANDGEYIYVIYDHEGSSRSASYVKESEANDDQKAHALTRDGSVVHYDYLEHSYSFVGWYKVLDKEMGTYEEYVANGNSNVVPGGKDILPPEIKENDNVEPYVFGTPVTEDTAIRAIWRRGGTIEIFFNPNDVDNNISGHAPADMTVPYENTPTDDHEGLDEGYEVSQNIFADLSHSQAVTAPIPDDEKYYFVGWKTPYGDIIQPNDLFTVYASLAKTLGTLPDGAPWYRYVLTAVYAEIDATTGIKYEINAPTASTPSSDELTDLGTPLDQTGKEYTGYQTGINKIDKLILNSAIKLSDGSGFSIPGYSLVGWNDDKSAADQGLVKFELGEIYGIGADTVGNGNTLYAVWGKPKFAVIHSSDGEIEYPSDNYTSGSTFDIYSLVSKKPGFMYGGYYSAYGGVTEAKWNTSMTAVEVTGWNDYTGEASQKGFWKFEDGYSVNGKAMLPEDGAIYYLKEVPNYYIKPYTQYVYSIYHGGALTDLIALGAIDDRNYIEAGFATISSTAEGHLVPKLMASASKKIGAFFNTLSVKKQSSENPDVVVKANEVVKVAKDPVTKESLADASKSYGGLLFYTSVLDYRDTSFESFDYIPYVVTKDGIQVINTTDRELLFDNWHYSLTNHANEGVRPNDTLVAAEANIHYPANN